MDNYRLILLLSLGVVLFLIYQAWIEDYGSVGQPLEEQIVSGEAPDATPEGVPASASAPTEGVLPVADSSIQQGDRQDAASEAIVVETDVLKVLISRTGGTVTDAWLKEYAAEPDRPDAKFQLLKAKPPNMFVAQSGLLGAQPDLVPTHQAEFVAERDRYALGDDDQLTVELTWQADSGVRVLKRYRFERGSYLIDASQEVQNNRPEPLRLRSYNQLQRTELHSQSESKFIRTYTGGVYYSQEEKYKKESFSDMEKGKLDRQVVGGWIAMIQHYFMSSWIPPVEQRQTFYTNVVGDKRYIIGMYSPALVIPAGAAHTFSDLLFVGPKLQETLASIAPGLELAVDYGWLTILAQPIFWVLNKIHSVIGNWGWSIIILTILIKLLFYKLSETSYRSMAGMRKLAPRLQALKDQYGDDKQQLNQAMMDLYKKEKINPLGGCLPILIQIPVFIALYWVLLESVELRHASFMLWLNNLSVPDPYYVLPLIMGVSMFVQTKLNPQPPDPIQAKVMMSLPFVFTVFFAFFPAGLVLYWTTNNILSIAQQWYIMRTMDRQEDKKKGKPKTKKG